MSEKDEGCPVSALQPGSMRSPCATAISEAALLTVGISALAPLLECLMSHMGASGEAKRQALAQNDQNSALDLSNLAQAISALRNASGGSRNGSESSRSSDRSNRPDLAVS